MARGYSRNPYSGYSGYGGSSGSTPSSPNSASAPSDYPVKDKEHSAAQHLEVLQKYHDEKKAAHGAMWRPPEQYEKDVVVNKAVAQLDRAFGKR